MGEVAVLCIALSLLALAGFAVISTIAVGDADRLEFEDPCESCCRWSECNGVDEDACPLWDAVRESAGGGSDA